MTEGLDADHIKWLEESGMARQYPAAAHRADHSSYSDEYAHADQQPRKPHSSSQEAAMNEVAEALGRLMQAEHGRPPKAPRDLRTGDHFAQAPQQHAPQPREPYPHAPRARDPRSRDPHMHDPHYHDPRDPWQRADLRAGLDQSTSRYAYEDRYDPATDQRRDIRDGFSRDPYMQPRAPMMPGHMHLPTSKLRGVLHRKLRLHPRLRAIANRTLTLRRRIKSRGPHLLPVGKRHRRLYILKSSALPPCWMR